MPVKPLLASLVLVPALSQPVFAAGCDEAGGPGEVTRLAGFDAAGDLLLADGRAIRLVGLAPRQDEAEEARFRAAVQPYFGRQVTLHLSGERDRWSRWPARISVEAQPGEPPERDLARRLLHSHAATALPEGLPAPCAAPPAPAPGGTAGKGRPAASTAAGVIDGHDLAAVKAQEGRYVILEGRIASVGERPQRVYLNLSRRPKEAAAIVLSRRLWSELQAAGWTAAGLGGKRLRAHGVLGGRDGLLLDVTSRAALELID